LLLPSPSPLTTWPPFASWPVARQAPAVLVHRAKILLLTAEGVSNTGIGERLGISGPTVIARRRSSPVRDLPAARTGVVRSGDEGHELVAQHQHLKVVGGITPCEQHERLHGAAHREVRELR
jgi:hypothetical protein